MTIAVCCLCPEGVVLGADSTASLLVPGVGFHYLNHNQKLFELGEKSTLGVVTWGKASFGPVSHRTILAELADKFVKKPPRDVADASGLLIDHLWPIYERVCGPDIATLKALHTKAPFTAVAVPGSDVRTQKEQAAYNQLRMELGLGFCLAGRAGIDRAPAAYEIICDPLLTKPTPRPLRMGETRCWGTPKVFDRMVAGIDADFVQAIVKSGFWKGSEQDLLSLLPSHRLELPGAPIRDAVDFVHSCIVSTIKTLKFSRLSQTCGGPIELAVVTTDREFRWIRHKEWDAAIKEGHLPWKI